MKKKIILYFLIFTMIFTVLTGCVKNPKDLIMLEINQAAFLDYVDDFAEFVYRDFNTNDDLKKIDMFYFLVSQTYKNELENNREIKTNGKELQDIILPEKMLADTAKRLLNIDDYDFSPCHAEDYFTKRQYLYDFYDEADSTYCISLARGGPWGHSVGINKEKTIMTVDEDIITATTVIERYEDLDVIGETYEATYRFKYITDGDSQHFQAIDLITIAR